MPKKQVSSVSIIIPCYRHARFLRRAVESALGQTVAPSEIIVVDDGSADNVQAAIRPYSNLRLLRQPNRGPSAARNAGLQVAKSDKLVFLDADDILLPEAIAGGLRSFAGQPEAGFVYGAFRKTGWFGTRNEFRSPSTRLDLIRSNSIGMIAAVMFDRTKLLQIGGFDEQLRIAEDWDVYLRLSRLFSFVGHRELVASYARHHGNVTNDVARMRLGVEVVRRLERERGLSGEELAAWHEGAAVIAAAYPSLPQRLARVGRRLLALSGRRAPRQ